MQYEEKAGLYIQFLFEELAQANIEIQYIQITGRSARTGVTTSHGMSVLELSKGNLGPRELAFITCNSMKAAIQDKQEDMKDAV